MIDPGLVAAFKANPGRDVGRKLETAVFLETRRRRKGLFYYADGGEVDLCDGDGEMFINTCWSLADPATQRRESKAMALGRKLWPELNGKPVLVLSPAESCSCSVRLGRCS